MKGKLTQEQVAQIPELLKTLNRKQLAEKLGVTKSTIDYWAKKYRANGVKLPKWNGSLINKIVKNEQTNITIQGGTETA